MDRKIIISCDQAGGIKIDAENFTGASCEDATRVFENAYIGGNRKVEKKPEYYQPETHSVKAEQRF